MRRVWYILLFIGCRGAAFGQINWNSSALMDCTLSPIDAVNTSSLEFSPSFYDDGFIYIAPGITEKELDKNIGEPYFNLLFHSLSKTTDLSYQFTNVNRVNEHIGPATYHFSSDKLYYTQSKKYKRGKLKPVNKIMVAQRDTDQVWLPGVELSINSSAWSVQHPTLSEDGRMMIFSSNDPDGIGSFDLWMATWQDSLWSEPTNLGPGVNSYDNEAFPFLFKDSILFFASNGRGGIGQYDIYASIYQGGTWQNAINLGKKINSMEDDFGFIIDDNAMTAYLSSNKDGGKGKDDIFKVSFEHPLVTISAKVPIVPVVRREFVEMNVVLRTTDTHEAIEDAFVTLIPFTNDVNKIWESFEIESIESVEGQNRFLMNVIPKTENEELQTRLSDKDGSTTFQIEKHKEYLITMQKEGFKAFTTTIKGEKYLDTMTIELAPVIVVTDDADLLLSVDTALSALPEKLTSDESENNEVDEDLENSLNNLELVVFDQIYYKYNSTKISPNSTEQLDQLALYMKRYPEIKVELIAHTDCRGNRSFNEKLSLSRALSAKDYLTNKGIDADRIIALGKGEDEIRNHCTDGVYCTEKEHEFNRRTEVRVIMN